MKVLDIAAGLVQKVLGALPPEAGALLWFPAFAVLLLLALRFTVRRVLPHVGTVAVHLARLAIAVISALLLGFDFAAASWFRLARTRPPEVVYTYGDAVTGAAMNAQLLADKASAGFSALSRTHFSIIMVGAAVWLWAWDHGHCGEPTVPDCVGPITEWARFFA